MTEKKIVGYELTRQGNKYLRYMHNVQYPNHIETMVIKWPWLP